MAAGLSIVVVTYNSASTVSECLLSVLCATPEAEVLVVDNNSGDNTTQIVAALTRRDRRVTLIQNETNVGYSVAANQGVQASKGEVVILLNPDTRVPPGGIVALGSRLEDKSVGAVGPLCNQVIGRQFIGYHVSGDGPRDLETVQDMLNERNAGKSEGCKLLIGFCLAIRRETLDEMGLLDENLILGNDDLDLCWRLTLAGYKLLIALDVLVAHDHGTSFKTLPKTEKDRVLHQSNMAMLDKLRAHYGDLTTITSNGLWDCPIFDTVLVHDQTRIRAQQNIPGWFDFADIYDAAVAEAEDGAHFVEVGCWLGKSTCYLAQAIIRSGKRIDLTVIDTFEGVPGDELQELLEPYGGSVFDAFIQNLHRCSVQTVPRVIKENSRTAHRHFADSSLDFVFIDADHSYEGVKADIQNFLPKIKPGGLFGGHDYNQAPGVQRAVDEILGHCPASRTSWLIRKSVG